MIRTKNPRDSIEKLIVKHNNDKKDKNMTKQEKKALKKTKQRQSAVARHADYEATQERIVAPFGKTLKTGGHQTGKRDISRKRQKQALSKNIF
jgi:hypothetical protein